jgi:fermentation-respiration switch protein FrsA (DUF1100 family)
MRTDISFTSHGLTCRGWLYRPQNAENAPAIVMSHGLSAVKELGLTGFAETFCAAGFVVVVFDYRFQGESDGAERGRIIPQEQHDDIRAAITYTAALPEVDAERIGYWGSSYSGGHALFLGAFEPRIKVVVSQVPAIALARALLALAGREGFAYYLDVLAQDFTARNAGAEGGKIPIVAPPGEPAILSTPDSYDWFMKNCEGLPGWVNYMTLESVARMAEYWPAAFIDLVTPKPLLIQAAVHDSLIPIEHVREAFSRAGEPKKLVEYDGGHFDFYTGERLHGEVVKEAAAWFKAHL